MTLLHGQLSVGEKPYSAGGSGFLLPHPGLLVPWKAISWPIAFEDDLYSYRTITSWVLLSQHLRSERHF